jgi:O-methyltransferase
MLGTDLRGTGRNLHLFDRWGDLPEATDRDGDFASLVTAETIPQILEDSGASEAQAATRELLIDRLGMSPEHVTFHAGWFDQTLPAYTGGPVTFAHVDADFYDSTRLAFDFLERHMTDRALVVLDDWEEWRDCPRNCVGTSERDRYAYDYEKQDSEEQQRVGARPGARGLGVWDRARR